MRVLDRSRSRSVGLLPARGGPFHAPELGPARWGSDLTVAEVGAEADPSRRDSEPGLDQGWARAEDKPLVGGVFAIAIICFVTCQEVTPRMQQSKLPAWQSSFCAGV
jgi:hypothetical protein